MGKVIQEKLTKIRDERKAKLGDVPAWVDESNQLGEKVQEKIKEKNALRDEFKAKEREYYQYLAEVRKARQEKQQEERVAWQKERDQANLMKKAEKLEDQPYVAEITLIEQTIAFCESLTKKKTEAEEQEKKEIDHGDTKGLEVLMKKEDRDEEYYYAPTAKGKKSKGKKGAKAEGSSAKPIKHNAETFRLFDQLKLNAPITTDEVPPLLDQLQAKLADFQQKVKVWEETKEEQKKKILAGLDIEEEEKEEEKEEAKEE